MYSFYFQEIDVGQLFLDNGLAIGLIIFLVIFVWKGVWPFWVEREKKREEVRIRQEEAREQERVAREERYLKQQEESIKMIQGFQETIQMGYQTRNEANKAFIENLGKIAEQLEKHSYQLEEIIKIKDG